MVATFLLLGQHERYFWMVWSRRFPLLPFEVALAFARYGRDEALNREHSGAQVIMKYENASVASGDPLRQRCQTTQADGGGGGGGGRLPQAKRKLE